MARLPKAEAFHVESVHVLGLTWPLRYGGSYNFALLTISIGSPHLVFLTRSALRILERTTNVGEQ